VSGSVAAYGHAADDDDLGAGDDRDAVLEALQAAALT
jgi:hypothetical protein